MIGHLVSPGRGLGLVSKFRHLSGWDNLKMCFKIKLNLLMWIRHRNWLRDLKMDQISFDSMADCIRNNSYFKLFIFEFIIINIWFILFQPLPLYVE